MPPPTDKGIIAIQSKHSVDETVTKLKAILQAKAVMLFALVDHSGEAEKVGMHMPPTKLLIFGNPKAGTPLMLATPGIALDLPLKLLVSEDAHGQVWLSYNSPAYLQARHNLPPGFFRRLPPSRRSLPTLPPESRLGVHWVLSAPLLNTSLTSGLCG
jgi:uncharacterized protein (DUF302 family)